MSSTKEYYNKHAEEYFQKTKYRWIELIKTFGPILVGIAAIISSYLLNKKMLKLKENEDEIKKIYQQLGEFYGPLQQYLNKSTELYKNFTFDKPKGFRAVKAILQGHQFSGNDEILLNEIIKIGEKIEDLILSKSGLIDDSDLRQRLLPQLGKHIMLLRLMFRKDIKAESEKEFERFKEDVFPREVDIKIEERIKDLQYQLKGLGR